MLRGGVPWGLVRGDRGQNLVELSEGPMPSEPVSQQIWRLMQQGFNKHQLETALWLMADLSWTSLAVEQQHDTTASIHRHHHEYGEEILTTRSLAMQARRT